MGTVFKTAPVKGASSGDFEWIADRSVSCAGRLEKGQKPPVCERANLRDTSEGLIHRKCLFRLLFAVVSSDGVCSELSPRCHPVDDPLSPPTLWGRMPAD